MRRAVKTTENQHTHYTTCSRCGQAHACIPLPTPRYNCGQVVWAREWIGVDWEQATIVEPLYFNHDCTVVYYTLQRPDGTIWRTDEGNVTHAAPSLALVAKASEQA